MTLLDGTPDKLDELFETKSVSGAGHGWNLRPTVRAALIAGVAVAAARWWSGRRR